MAFANAIYKINKNDIVRYDKILPEKVDWFVIFPFPSVSSIFLQFVFSSRDLSEFLLHQFYFH